ncbi:MAG: anti-sigma factor [Terracoccus sp.]
MSHPDDEILVDLAINGADVADTSSSVHLHLSSCVVCSATVGDLRRTLSFAKTSSADAVWVAPPASVWERITAQIEAPNAAPSVTDVRPSAADLPPLSASRGGGSLSSSRTRSHRPLSDDTDSGPTSLQRRRDQRERGAERRPRLVGWAAGIAAAGLVVGLLTGRALWNGPTALPVATATTTSATTVSQVALNTLDASDPRQLGEAAVVRTARGYELKIDTTKPVDAGTGYLEVWLINRDLKRMVSVGMLRGNGIASFPISQNLIDQGYVVVDVSRQQFIEDTTHSGDSVMRGKLPA